MIFVFEVVCVNQKQSKEKWQVPLCRNLVQIRSAKEATATSEQQSKRQRSAPLLSAYLDQDSGINSGPVTDY